MSFSESSMGVYLEGTTLHASCQNGSDQWVHSSLDLDTVLGNNNGDFDTNSTGFSKTAQDITLEEDTNVLRAKLKQGQTWKDASIDLNSFIKNDDGQLKKN